MLQKTIALEQRKALSLKQSMEQSHQKPGKDNNMNASPIRIVNSSQPDLMTLYQTPKKSTILLKEENKGNNEGK